MSESKDSDNETTGGTPQRTLSLKKTVGSGQVRQSFSHGRSKSVVVEKKRRRVITPKADAGATPEAAQPEAKAPQKAATKPATQKPKVERAAKSTRKPAARGDRKSAGGLTQGEQAARERALALAKSAEEERSRIAAQEEAERQQRALEAKAKREAEAEATAEAEAKAEAEAQREAEAREQAAQEAATADTAQEPVGETGAGAEKRAVRRRETQKSKSETPDGDEDDGLPAALKGARIKRKTGDDSKPAQRTKGEQRRRTGRLTIQTALDEDLGERQRSLASIRRSREKEKQAAKHGSRPQKFVREVVIPEAITAQELANRMAVRVREVLRVLRAMEEEAVAADMVLEPVTAQLVVEEMGHRAKLVAESDVEHGLETPQDDVSQLETRPPVVTVMGHVDHGKTSLLDALRKTDVVSGEKGGITQHIGAYQVTTDQGQKVTFIDTPGHAAFTAMRARGAGVTDIVVLVVAADDGVMPQTIEAINHAKAAEVPLIVAVNKIDRPEADTNKARQELLQYEVFTEDLGGDVLSVDVSALKGTNLDKLVDAILLQAELLELTANPNREANGVIVEAQLDKTRGPVATVLVQGGTLKRGDIIVAGAEWGRVRALTDEHGKTCKQAGPSTPVEILGLQGVPKAGDDVVVVDSESRAREVCDFRRRRAQEVATGGVSSVEDMFAKLKEAEIEELPIVIKADVQGSVEAIRASLDKLGTDEVRAKILHAAAGGITESDITLAEASQAPVFGFNVRANKQAKDLADTANVDIRYYNVIYDLIDDVKAMLSGMLSPERRETMLGNAKVLDVFKASKMGKAAGCLVTDGIVRRGAGVRVIRDDVVVHEGSLSSLRRFKDEVREVNAGTECGMAFENFQDIKVDDVVECYEVEEVTRTL